MEIFHEEPKGIDEMSLTELNVLGWNAFIESDETSLASAAQTARLRATGYSAISEGQHDSQEWDKLATTLENDLKMLRTYLVRG
ncbi:hypothetical protein HYU82_03230 [Candidatus Saccharibacteria bacterium]|nr:hypothetical protein [Candidatus Saccharibacteria bacterium]MBI2285810.1 hypothetical protein [Candidatus Saccharibacteria bacterium]